MARSSASTVEQYLSELPDDRRETLSAVRQCILENLPAGYEEAMGCGMIVYQIPLSRYPKTYNGQPLMYAALAAEKNYLSLHLMSVYQDPTRLKDAFRRAGKKLDMGKACIRFRKLEDLPLEAIGQIIAGVPVEGFISVYEASRRRSVKEKSSDQL